MYSNINENKERVISIIKWLINEVLSSGGDGHGIWYSKFYKVDDIKRLIWEYKLLPQHWEIEEKDGDLHLGENQEWLIISNDEAAFECRPEWQQVSLVW